MIWKTQPPKEQAAGESGLPQHLLSLLASLAGYFRARLELAGLEGKDAAGLFAKIALIVGVALALLAFGYAFLWIGLIALAAAGAKVPWGWLVLAAALLHLLGVAGCAFLVRALWSKPVFTATLDEFRKDQEWLKSQK